MKSIVSIIKTVSLLIGSTADPSSTHRIGAGLPVPAVLCQVGSTINYTIELQRGI